MKLQDVFLERSFKNQRIRRILAGILVMAVILGMTGCSGFLDRTGLLSNQAKIEAEACEAFEKDFFQALEKEDPKLVKKLFSPRALQRAEDLDEGIEYLFGLCGGEKAVFKKDNKSAYQNIEKKKNTWEMHAYCFFTCGDREFKVNWTQYLEYDEDERMIGVYTLNLCPSDDTYATHSIYSAAGIHHPGRYAENEAIWVLDTLYLTDHKATDRNPEYKLPDESTWSGLWDEDVFSELDQQDKDDMAHFFLNDRSREFGPGWFEITKDGSMIYHCKLRFALQWGCFGVRFNEDGKITGIAVDIYHESYNEVKEGIHGFDDTRSEKDN
ncbi:MAG: DUF5104 domain-containing protein [Clostridiales bacterium]|nr:DUF5104 domain-containing protein [Clostridiales bacterium]